MKQPSVATEKAVEVAISKFFNGARDRHGGRSRPAQAKLYGDVGPLAKSRWRMVSSSSDDN